MYQTFFRAGGTGNDGMYIALTVSRRLREQAKARYVEKNKWLVDMLLCFVGVQSLLLFASIHRR